MYQISSNGISWNCFKVDVESKDQINPDFTVFCMNQDVDKTAKMLSRQFPDKYVKLTAFARIKAVYVNGHRIVIHDYQDFYSNLNTDEYNATKIQDCDTGEWI